MISNKNLDYPIIDVDEFTTISNSLLQGNEISADAQLVATFLLSMPKFKHDGTPWGINPRHVWNSKNIGKDRVYKAINELCDLGYMQKVPRKNGIEQQRKLPAVVVPSYIEQKGNKDDYI